MSDDDTRDAVRRADNLETDPARRELFRLLHTLDDLVRAQQSALAPATYQAIDTIVLELLEALRMLKH